MIECMERRYKKIIILACFLALFVNQGMASTSFNVYQPYIVALPDVSDTGGSFVLTIRTFVSLIVMLFVASYYRRLDVRIGLFSSSLCTAIGFIIFSLVGFHITNSLLILCIGAIFTGVGYGLGGMVAITTLIGSWFRGHFGGVIGIAGTGSGIASILIPVAAVEIIQKFSLEAAFCIEGAAAIVLAILLLILVRNKPSDVGLAPITMKDRFIHKRKGNVCIASGDMPASERRIMEFACMLIGAVNVVAMSYLTVLMTSSGIATLVAAALTSICGAVLTASKLLSGWTFDAIGTRNASFVFFVILILGLLSGFMVGQWGQWAAFFASVLIGLGCSIGTTGLAIWSLELSSVPNRMRITKNLNISYALGAFIFNMMPGVLKAALGSYELTYLILAIMCGLAAVLVMIVYAQNTKRCKEQMRKKESCSLDQS